MSALLRNLLIALPLLFVAWISILALVLRLGGQAPAVLVPFPPDKLLASLGSDVAITDVTSISITLNSDQPGLVRRLYAAGAWLVLPSGLDACIPNILRRQDRAGAAPD